MKDGGSWNEQFCIKMVVYTNHKDIGTLCCIFSAIAKVTGICYSIIICMALAQFGNQILGGNHQLYKC